MQVNFHRIPEEMRQYRQWVCWCYEDRDGTKPTKIPYNPVTGRMASVIEPSDWVSFNDAVRVATAAGSKYSGIGFVLTDDDPYTFVDLDHSDKEAEKISQQKVFDELNSYSELSPSGRGLHIITKAKILQGRRRSNIELYYKERYMTMTGNVWHDKPIEERQEVITTLWEQMGAGVGKSIYSVESKEQTLSDAEVIQKASNAANGVKFTALHEGRWNECYNSQSEADLAYINMIAFYTQNIDQIIRLFWACPLGQRQKAKRTDYVMQMVHLAFDNILPPIDFIEVKRSIEATVVEQNSKPANPTRVLGIELLPLTRPPGLMGDIMDFIYASSYLPVKEIALASAIGLMAGICGRPYNINGTGLNMYVLLLAKTGRGKEAVGSGISKIMKKLTQMSPDGKTIPAAENFIGPAEISSGVAILRRLSDVNKRCFVSIIGEFGLKMQQLSSPRASTAETTLKKTLLDLYNKSGAMDVFGGSAYAEADKNIPLIPNPSVSILAESTPSTFYGAINENLIRDGLLPRFLVIEYTGARVYDNEGSMHEKPSSQLIEKITDLCLNSLNLQRKEMVVDIDIVPEAQEFLRTISRNITDLINGTENDTLAELWNRAHVKTLKLAALTAVGNDMHFPKIDLPTAQWAFNIIAHDVYNITGRFVRGEVGQDTNQVSQMNKLIEVTREYLTKPYDALKGYDIKQTMHEARIIPHSYYSRRLLPVSAFKHDLSGGANAALNRTIKMLIADGDLVACDKSILRKEHNYNGEAYITPNPARIFSG